MMLDDACSILNAGVNESGASSSILLQKKLPCLLLRLLGTQVRQYRANFLLTRVGRVNLGYVPFSPFCCGHKTKVLFIILCMYLVI